MSKRTRPRAKRPAAVGLCWALGAACCGCRSAPAGQPQPPRSHPPVSVPERPLDSESPAQNRGLTRAPTPREQAAIDTLMRTAERVRGLRFVREVPVRVQDRIAIMAFAESQIEADELRRATTIYTALGLLPRELDVRALLLRLLGEQVVGYYDERAARLVVRDEIMRAFERTADGRRPNGTADGAGGSRDTPIGTEQRPAIDLTEARLTIVHELVHALQDQRLGLAEKLEQERDIDASNAFKALYEGDAMLAMSIFASAEARESAAPHALPGAARGSPLAATELQRAPAIVRIPLLFAYLDGLAFAAHLFAQGGFQRIDQAYATPPLSTEQVLHPERSERERLPDNPRWPAPQADLGPGYELLYEDTLGELELSVYFGSATRVASGQRTAAGWGGDRLYVYRSIDAELVAVWLTTWDSEFDAIEASGAAERVRTASGASAHRQLVRRAGRSVLIVRNADAQLQARLLAQFAVWARH